MKILHCEQGSTEWSLARCGVVTASEAKAIITPGWKPTTGEGRRTYLLTKVAEKIMGSPRQTGGSWSMEQGTVKEGSAAGWYEFSQNCTVQHVGLCLSDDGLTGCSPDALVGEDGGLEIKSPESHTHIGYLLDGGMPRIYLPQVHFSLFVTGRSWWDFLSYHPFLPKLLVRVRRDEAIIAAIASTLAQFATDFDAALTRVRSLLPKGTT
jgi:hypothetical protein